MGKVNRGRGRERDESLACHTFAVYDKFRTVTVRSHEYCFVVYLLFGPFRFAINDFEQLHCVSPQEPLTVSVRETVVQIEHTVLVMPSVNRTSSMLLPGPSQSGFRVRTSLRAEACESAWL